MVGPEDSESLAKVKGVSKVFNTTHILPHFLAAKEHEEESVFYVSMERIKEQAEVKHKVYRNTFTKLTTKRYLQWKIPLNMVFVVCLI